MQAKTTSWAAVSGVGFGWYQVKGWSSYARCTWRHHAESHGEAASGQQIARAGQRLEQERQWGEQTQLQRLRAWMSGFVPHSLPFPHTSLCLSPTCSSSPSFPFPAPSFSPTTRQALISTAFLHIPFLLLVSKRKRAFPWKSGTLHLNHHKTRKGVLSRLQIRESRERLLLSQLWVHPRLWDLMPGLGH